MKGKTSTLRVNRPQRKEIPYPRRLWAALVPGSLLLLGFWGTATELWSLGTPYLPFAFALLYLTAALCVRWEVPWQAWGAIGVLVLSCAGCVLLAQPLGDSLTGLWQTIGTWWLSRTGTCLPGGADPGDPTAALLLLSGLSGLAAGWSLRQRVPVQLILSPCIFVLWLIFSGSASLWIGLFLLGTLLSLPLYTAGWGKKQLLAAVAALLTGALSLGILSLTGVSPEGTGLDRKLSHLYHRLQWESADSPLPEGDLTQTGPFRPTQQPALTVTMSQWTALYLRGFTGGHYTGAGWEPAELSALPEAEDTLYALQQTCFFPAQQLSAAAQSVEKQPENSIRVENVGACRYTSYLPYGLSQVSEGILHSTDLAGEGQRAPTALSYTAGLYSVENAYLLQEQISHSSSQYRRQEAVYRQWVYDRYLTVPEETAGALAEVLDTGKCGTTVQATREITRILQEALSYEEATVTVPGRQDAAAYVLQVSRCGYSVHYATLAALMLRCCGIPARYVEGYVISPSQAEVMADGESLTLTQKNAHAWAEYYLDGVGWIPFDPTPGYSQILSYTLPENGQPTQQTGATVEQPPEEPPETPQQSPEVRQDPPKASRFVYLRQAIGIGLILLLAVLLLLAARTYILRRRLKKRIAAFATNEPRAACAGILTYLRTLTGTEQAFAAASTLARRMALSPSIPPEALAELLNWVWFSPHPVTPEQREQALAWLAAAQTHWKCSTGRIKRLKERFLTCKIL